MMAGPDGTVYRCPVCRRPVQKTMGGNICGHYDRAHEPCPGSFQPITLALAEQAHP